MKKNVWWASQYVLEQFQYCLQRAISWSWQMKAPNGARIMLWFTVFIFDQGEIHYCLWIGRSMRWSVPDWHCHSSQCCCQRALYWPWDARHVLRPVCLQHLPAPPCSSPLITLLYSWQGCHSPLTSAKPNNGCQKEGKFCCQREFSAVFDGGYFIVGQCALEWVNVRKNKSRPKLKPQKLWFQPVL